MATVTEKIMAKIESLNLIGSLNKVKGSYVFQEIFPTERRYIIGDNFKAVMKNIDFIFPESEAVSRKEFAMIYKEKMNNRRRYMPAPTRKFKIGDKVRIGNLEDCEVFFIFDDGCNYGIRYTAETTQRPKEKYVTVGVWAWFELHAYQETYDMERVSKPNTHDINFKNCRLESLLTYRYSFGIDMNPDYQRDLVWGESQKVELIDSIFNHVDIGKFCFFRRDDWPREDSYEIIDGKQRINTICDFYEDRFRYKGKLYSELHPIDRGVFKRFPVAIGEVAECDKKDIYTYFLKLNTTGREVDKDHLRFVRSLLENIDE